MKSFIFILLVLCLGKVQAQSSRPSLVVGIVVDQMRQEYLYRYQNKFSDKGFRLLMNEGFYLTNAHYNYMPTETGPGHASVYTASSPSIHGIVANDWWDRETKKEINCVETQRFKAVGIAEGAGAAPDKLLSTTITDELKISSQGKAKVYGISIKDRGAILPAGHSPNGAFWFDQKSGNFITSTYYQKELPSWLTQFNQQKLVEKMSKQVWKTLLPMEQYTESGADESPYERKYAGKTNTSFPHDLAAITAAKKDFSPFTATPFANDILLDLSKVIIENEKLGTGDACDFLAISFSATDKLGHQLEPNAVEIEDMYLRLDKTIAELIQYLDSKVGKNKYTLFLTADHGAVENRQYLADRKIPSGIIPSDVLETELKKHLQKIFPDRNIIEKVSSEQVYLNADAFSGEYRTAGIERAIAEEAITQYLKRLPGIAEVYATPVLRHIPLDERSIRGNVIRGFNSSRSGDISYVMQPQWVTYPIEITGTGHGAPYAYDTHVPVLFYGKQIPAGKSSQYHVIQDIAATVAVLIGTKYPSGCIGNPIVEITDK